MRDKLLEDSYLEVFVLIAVICIGIWLIVWIRTRFRDREDPTETDQQMLIEIRDLHRQGDLSDEEFRSIKGRLVERLDDFMRERESNG